MREPLSLEAAINHAAQVAEQAKRSGYDQEGLEQAAREGYALGLFEELEGEAVKIVQEFYPPGDSQGHGVRHDRPAGHKRQNYPLVRELSHD